MSLIRWDPFREVLSLRDAMDRLFEESFIRPTRAWPWGAEGGLSVPVDLYETEDSFVVSAAVPGLKPEDVDISVTGNTLTIRGEFQAAEEGKRGNVHFQERRYGKFQRSVALPSAVNMDAVDATFENGIVRVTFPKTEEMKPRQIPVTVKK